MENYISYKGNKIYITNYSYVVSDDSGNHEFETEEAAIEYIDNRDRSSMTQSELDYFTPGVSEFEDATGLKLNQIDHNKYVVAEGGFDKVSKLVKQFNDDYNAFVSCYRDNFKGSVIVTF